MQKETFVVRTEWTRAVLKLGPEQGYAVFCAMMLYHDQGPAAAHEALRGHDLAEFQFLTMESVFESNALKYNDKRIKAAASGSLGGQAKAAKQQGKGKGKQPPNGATSETTEDTADETAEENTPAKEEREPSEPSEKSTQSWKTAGWNALLAASWTQDNLMVARGVWFTNVCPWIESHCHDDIAHLPEGVHQDIADACRAYIADVIVTAVSREAQLSPLAEQASKRHPYDLAKWLRDQRWLDGTYADATWAQTLADAQGRAARGGNHSGSMSPGEETLCNIMQGMGSMPVRDAVEVDVQEEDDGNADSDAQ
ncbi:MAG: hypothetical protein K6E40_16690 [Desulfovibrio sp.]|nr:hypothetical protein [Desulfovibrio sp.]